MGTSRHCVVCGSTPVEPALDFGPQALCNRFLQVPGESEALFGLALGVCRACALTQIVQPVPPAELKARVDWLTYNEQEGHLNNLVDNVCRLPGVDRQSTVGAISFKDDSTVERFCARGHQGWRLDPRADLGIDDPCAGLETIQAALTPEKAAAIAARRGRADILIARHILEHAHDATQFAAALKALVAPGGHIIFEAPDCAPALTRFDYTMPWEEHISYFTPETFQAALPRLGFTIVGYDCYVYANENSLVAVTQPGTAKAIDGSAADLLTRNYASRFEPTRQRAAQALRERRARGQRVAIFGAGHLSCAWVNFLGVAEFIDFFVDDHPRKRGLFMPGSRLPIKPSAALLDEKINLCLLSLSPESEAKVLARNQNFTAQGGEFASIFPGKSNSLI